MVDLYGFSIPMRGNEDVQSMSAVRYWSAGFSIPMRGNESRSSAAAMRSSRVFDPHEG